MTRHDDNAKQGHVYEKEPKFKWLYEVTFVKHIAREHDCICFRTRGVLVGQGMAAFH